MITPGTKVRHKNPKIFEDGQSIFSGVGMVTECHGSDHSRVLWQDSQVETFHRNDHLDPLENPSEDSEEPRRYLVTLERRLVTRISISIDDSKNEGPEKVLEFAKMLNSKGEFEKDFADSEAKILSSEIAVVDIKEAGDEW